MDAFAGSLTVGVVLFALLANLIVGAVLLWLTIKIMVNIPGGVRFRQCFLCVLYLNIMTGVSLILLMIPLGLLGLVTWMIVWYLAAKAIVEGVFEITSGATLILVMYWLVNIRAPLIIRSEDEVCDKVSVTSIVMS